jgi:polygalacturonase
MHFESLFFVFLFATFSFSKSDTNTPLLYELISNIIQQESLTTSPIVVSILSYGGVGDGVTDNTAAFTSAIAAITSAGSGTLFIPTGHFLTGPFNLTNDMTLLLGDGAVILGGVDYKTWPIVPPLWIL